MNILDMLKKGKSVEDLTEEFYDNLENAVAEYEAWKEEEEKKAKARQAASVALVDYLKALGAEVTDERIETIDFMIKILPDLEVARW